MRAPIKLLHLGRNFGDSPGLWFRMVRYPGGRVPLARGRPGTSGPWAAGYLRRHLVVISRILPWDPRSLGHLTDVPAAGSSHGCAGRSVIWRICRPLGHLADLPAAGHLADLPAAGHLPDPPPRWSSGGSPPVGHLTDLRRGGAVGHWDRSLRRPPVLNVNCLAHGRPEGWEADSRCGGGRGRGRRPLGPFWGRIRNSRRFERVQGAADSSIEPDWKSESVCRRISRIR